jgi:glucosamine kinase
VKGLRLLGLDIGGTMSRARLSADGQVAAESTAASASLPAAGLEGAGLALAELLAGVGVDYAHPVDAICAGSAGLSVPGAREFLHERLAPLAPQGALAIVSDAMLVLPAAGLDDGIAVICGTGSIAVASLGGQAVQAGGWGFLLGDEGSGYWIVREAVRELLGRRDRGTLGGELATELLPATGAADLAALHRLYYDQPHLPGHWARYARLVLASRDPAAGGIVARAATAVAALAEGAAARLGSAAGLPVVLAGGLAGNEVFLHAVGRAVAARLPGSEFSVLAAPPVTGAVRLAGQAAHAGSPREP